MSRTSGFARKPAFFVLCCAVICVSLYTLFSLAGRDNTAFADEVEKCTVAIKGDSPVARACAEGGVRTAKRKMKELVRLAKEKGMSSECNDCHNGPDSWTLTKGATEKFRRMIELTK